jgi:periplasmic mercuric ion binding protein
MKIFLLSALFLIVAATIFNAQSQKKTNEKKFAEVIFIVNMHCQNCKDRIEKNIPFEKGVKDLTVDLEKKEVTIVFNPQKTSIEKLKKAVIDLGYTCEQKEVQKKDTRDSKL